MKYFSMFSGIGGFEYGIRQGKAKSEDSTNSQSGTSQLLGRPLCVGFSEIDKYAIQIYKKHFPTHKEFGNATRIIPEEIEDFDLLCGGFPCQAFSIAGKRGGFKDIRGTLFHEIARIASVKRPKLLFLENVKGLLSHDNGRTFGTILSTFSELGYVCEWQVLNSKDFGVPQNRERVFIIGHLRGTSGSKIFPLGKSDKRNCSEHKKREGICYDTRANTLKARDYKGGGNLIKVIGSLDGEGWEKRHEQIRRVYGIDGISPTIPTGTGGGVMTKVAIPVLTPDRKEKRQNGRRFKEDGDPAFTLTSQDKHGVYDGIKIRRLTPTECERLQGFPDNWTAEGINGPISDSQRYKCLGNAVTTNVIQAIMEKILKGAGFSR